MLNQQVDKKNTVRKDSAIPPFMTEAAAANYAEDIDSQSSWLTKNLYRLMIWISIIWFGIVLIYITQFFGWSNLFLMMPDEFGGFMAGITLPLAIIWVVMAYIDRGTSFKNEARFLRAYMNQLVYPEDGSAKTAKAMADAIRSQVVELQQATKLATEQTDKIQRELGSRVEDFSRLVSVLDNYSSKTVVELADTVKDLAKTFDSLNDKAKNSAEDFRGYVGELSSGFVNLQKDTEKLFTTLSPKLNEVRAATVVLKSASEESNTNLIKTNELILNLAEKSNNNLSQAAEILSSQAKRIEQVSKQAVTDCNGLRENLDISVDRLTEIMQEQSKTMQSNVSLLNRDADILQQKFSAHSELVGKEVDKIMSRAHVAEESIALQVRELSGVSEDVLSSMHNVELGIKEQVERLQKMTDIAVDNINTVVESLNSEASNLADIADKSILKTTAVTDDLVGKQNILDNAAVNIMNNMKSLAVELKERTEQVKDQTNLSIAQFNEVGMLMKKNSESLTEASSIVVAQSKVSEAALAQQQRHINGSISRIEEIKGELKREMDELTRTASLMNEDALQVIKGLKEQMEYALAASESVVEKTKMLNDSLRDQSADFDKSTENTLSKVTLLNDSLNKQCQKLDTFSQNIEARTINVAQTLNKQAEIITKSTAASEKTHADILNAFETQSTLLNSVAENTVGYVSDVVKALDEKAESVSLLFKHQENEFFNICERISENTNNIGSSLKKQISVIEQSADRVFSRLAVLEEDAGKRSDNVNVLIEKSINKLSELNNAVAGQNEEVSGLVTAIAEKLGSISNDFRNDVAGFNQIVDIVREETDKASASLLSNCERLNEANDNLGEKSKSVANMMDINIQNLDSALTRTQAQSETIRETLGHQVESLSDIINVVSTQSRLGEASLAQQYKYLSDVSSDVAKRMNEINNQFKVNAEGIVDNTSKISYEFDVLGDKLLKIGEETAKSAKNSVKNIEQVNMSLNQTAEDMDKIVVQSNQKVSSVMKEYENYIASFNTVTAEASTGVIEINDLISQQNDKMLELSKGTKELVAYFNTVLNDTSVELSNRANQAYDKVKGLGENLKKLSLQLEDTTKQSSGNLENAGTKLRASLSEAAANAERIANDIRASGEVFLKQSDVLSAASGETIEKVSLAIKELTSGAVEFNEKGEDILKKTNGFNVVFKQQLQTLLDTSGKAENKIKELEKLYEGIRVDAFLRNASYVLERLENAAVDINRIFNPNVEEELWKKYYNGDTAAFVRHLAKSLSRSQIIAIKNEFESNQEFRDIVTRYLTDFEGLVGKAKDSENSGLLLSVISGADVGKLYYVLAKSLDRIN